MTFLQVLILAVVQGIAELLPVSSSAHVILAEKLMGLDPTSPQMTLLLVMLHTGTMFAVIVYFWRGWKASWFGSTAALRQTAVLLAIATALTGVVGLGLLQVIKHGFAADASSFEIEQLFGNSRLIAAALAAAGVLILLSSRIRERAGSLSGVDAAWVGAVQGLCLPFRGFSRSGATISTALLRGVARVRAEEFSFALAVVLTPAVIVKEALRVHAATVHGVAVSPPGSGGVLALSLIGMALSFLAGLLALRWLSRWLESGRWYLFGIYCLVLSACVLRFVA